MVRTTIWSAIALALIVLAKPASAQKNERGFSLHNFRAAPGFGSFLTLDGAFASDKDLGLRTGLLWNYQSNPLVLKGCAEATGTECTRYQGGLTGLVKNHTTVELFAAVSIFRVFEFGLAIPLVIYQAGDSIPAVGGLDEIPAPSSSFGLSDMRIHMKLDLLHGIFGYKGRDFGLAIVPVITFPVADVIHNDQFLGDSSFTINPKLAFGIDPGPVRFGFLVGYLFREAQQFYDATMGSRFTYGIGSELPVADFMNIMVEFFGESAFSSEILENPLEAAAALKFRLTEGLHATVGGGAGIVRGAGTPKFRIFAGLNYEFAKELVEQRRSKTPTEVDSSPVGDTSRESETISAQRQSSPEEAVPWKAVPHPKVATVATKKTGDIRAWDLVPKAPDKCAKRFRKDKCRTDDQDGDGIPDRQDRCPDEPEDVDEYQDRDGCPDRDNDQDGVVDAEDACPRQPEDRDGHRDDDGCPDVDNDNDGILDDFDRCPNRVVGGRTRQDKSGCPL